MSNKNRKILITIKSNDKTCGSCNLKIHSLCYNPQCSLFDEELELTKNECGTYRTKKCLDNEQ